MEVASARARLVDSADNGASPALATIPRSEIEAALSYEEGPPELILDITRYAGEGDQESGQVAVLWGPEDLEELLRRADGDSVTLAFDPDELLQAFEADVEGHGIREVAAVLAVAVAAGVGAGMASAQTDQTTGSSGSAAIEQVRSDAAAAPGAAIEAARSAEGAQTLAASAGQPVAADIEAVRSTEAATQAASGAPFDIEGVRLAQGEALLASTSEPTAAAVDIEAVRSTEAATQAASQAPFDIEGVRLAQGEQLLASEPAAAATDIEAVRSAANVSGLTAAESVEAARSTEIAASVASAQSATDIEAVRSAAAEATRAASDTGGGISISMPSPAVTGAIGGAVALLITGAAFAARRRPPVQPA